MDNQTKEMEVVKLYDPEMTALQNITKATLFHLDGSISEMKLFVPIYTRWGEAQELSYHPLSDYIESLTTCFIQISSYQISLGSINENGEEEYFIDYPITEIPLNKVYFNGRWDTPERFKKEEFEKRKVERDIYHSKLSK